MKYGTWQVEAGEKPVMIALVALATLVDVEIAIWTNFAKLRA